MAQKGWDEDRENVVKTLWADGYSGSQIAKRLGVTRNSVIGKVHRLGLSGRAVTSRKVTGKMAAAKRYRRNPSNDLKFGKVRSRVPIPTEPLPSRHITDIPRVSMVDLCEKTQCKFVCTEHAVGPYEKQFCGEPRVEGLPYCVPHSQRCYGGATYKGHAYGHVAKIMKGDIAALDAVKEFQDAN